MGGAEMEMLVCLGIGVVALVMLGIWHDFQLRQWDEEEVSGTGTEKSNCSS
jgi:hypothetical protein